MGFEVRVDHGARPPALGCAQPRRSRAIPSALHPRPARTRFLLRLKFLDRLLDAVDDSAPVPMAVGPVQERLAVQREHLELRKPTKLSPAAISKKKGRHTNLPGMFC